MSSSVDRGTGRSPAVRYTPGSTVLRREVLHGRPWLEQPVTVVADDGDVLAVLLEPGSPFTFHPHPFGPHPWSGHDAWRGPQVLQLHRTGDPYAVWKFFADGAFTHWYLNFETPLVRREGAFETYDHGLDLVVGADGARSWKDVEHLSDLLRRGRLTEREVLGVLAAAEAVAALLDRDDRWWSAWDRWAPGQA